MDTLSERMDKWKRSYSPGLHIVLKYALELASALAYLHSKRLVFRDVKPCNCGFLANGSLQLFDFGFCRSLPLPQSKFGPGSNGTKDDFVFHMSMAGTTRYQAPEMMIGQPYNSKVDVYSWSLVLYELVSKEKAYHNINRYEKFIRVVAEQHTRPETAHLELDHHLEELFQVAWCPDVENRWTMEKCIEYLEPIQRSFEEKFSKRQTAGLVRSFTMDSPRTSTGNVLASSTNRRRTQSSPILLAFAEC